MYSRSASKIYANTQKHALIINSPLKIWWPSVQIHPKVNLKSMKMCPWTALGRRSRPGRPQGVSGTKKFGFFLPIFEILFGIMGSFSAPREIADRSKIVLLSVDGHFDPRKCPLGGGSEKNMQIAWKIHAKIKGFWWFRTTFGVILFAYFTLSAFSKKIKKSMVDCRRRALTAAPLGDTGESD